MRLATIIESVRLTENTNPTAKELADKISQGVGPIFGDMYFTVRPSAILGGQAIVIRVARMHRNDKSDLKLSNTSVIHIHISSAESGYKDRWVPDMPAPDKLEAKALTQKRDVPTFRSRKDTPEKIVAYVVKWLRSNKDALIGPGIGEEPDGHDRA